MLFKHKHLLEELRSNGLRAKGEILSMKTLGEAGSGRSLWANDEDLTTTWFDVRMLLRVVPENRADPSFEATVMTRVHTLKFQGSHVPVWYDPRDHSRIVVDYEADADQIMRSLAEAVRTQDDGQRLQHRYDQLLGMAWTPVAGELLPVQIFTKPGTGHLTVDGELGRLVQDAAPSAATYVRSEAATLLPTLDRNWFATHDLNVTQAYGTTVPAGATAADGAATGIAIAVALVSLLGGHMVRTDVALTGGLTPTGELLPVGDFAETAAGAVKSYAKRLVAPTGNEPDVQQIPERKRQTLEFVFASNLGDALRGSLVKHPMKGFVPPEQRCASAPRGWPRGVTAGLWVAVLSASRSG